MKRIVAIVRPEKLEPLKEALFEADVAGMTIMQVNGCGNQHGWKEYFRGTEVLLNMVPKVKFEIVVDDASVDGIVEIILGAAQTGEVGDGKIFISPVDDVVRIRTGDVIKEVGFVGGCDGNLKAISKLVAGKNVEEVVSLLEGNTCGRRSTSCADQMCKAIREAQQA